MERPLTEIAPRFVDMAHRIGVAVAATVDSRGTPRTRVVQPVWRWEAGALTGVMSTATDSPKYRHLTATRSASVTYWNPEQDTCTADCDVELVDDADEKADAWERFLATPPPAGFDPSIHPDWESPASRTFGVVRLRPTWLRVMPGTLMTEGVGELWTWRAA
jgi:hypothetical protein